MIMWTEAGLSIEKPLSPNMKYEPRFFSLEDSGRPEARGSRRARRFSRVRHNATFLSPARESGKARCATLPEQVRLDVLPRSTVGARNP